MFVLGFDLLLLMTAVTAFQVLPATHSMSRVLVLHNRLNMHELPIRVVQKPSCISHLFPAVCETARSSARAIIFAIQQKARILAKKSIALSVSLLMCLLVFTRPVLASSGGRISGSCEAERSACIPQRSRSHSTRPSMYYTGNTRGVALEYRSSGSGVQLGRTWSALVLTALLALALAEPLSKRLKKSSFYEFQFVYFFDDKELQSVLSSLASASSEYASSKNIQSLVDNVCVLLSRRRTSLVGGNIIHKKFLNGDRSYSIKACDILRDVSFTERSKFDEQTTSNVNGDSTAARASVTPPASSFNTYFVLTLLLATRGPLLRVQMAPSYNSIFRPPEVFDRSILSSSDGYRSKPLTREYTDAVLRSLPKHLLELANTSGAAYMTDVVWTPDRVSASDGYSEMDMKSKWPQMQMF